MDIDAKILNNTSQGKKRKKKYIFHLESKK
jgi:hypothetical protein